jgi:hypothetical protein
MMRTLLNGKRVNRVGAEGARSYFGEFEERALAEAKSDAPDVGILMTCDE